MKYYHHILTILRKKCPVKIPLKNAPIVTILYLFRTSEYLISGEIITEPTYLCAISPDQILTEMLLLGKRYENMIIFVVLENVFSNRLLFNSLIQHERYCHLSDHFSTKHESTRVCLATYLYFSGAYCFTVNIL